MLIVIGLIITLGSVLGGFAHMGCNLWVLLEPSEYIVLLGSAFGVFVVANSSYVIKDTLIAGIQVMRGDIPKEKEYIEVLGCLYSLMREIRSKPKAEAEKHIEDPVLSPIFQKYPYVLKNKQLLFFICDYCRLILMGNARSFEIEALMDEEIKVLNTSALKSYNAIVHVADALPALGIVSAILGFIRALTYINVKPDILGGYIGSALVGTFAGVFFSYGIFGPFAQQIKILRLHRMRVFIVTRQTLLAFMNGTLPQIAIEYGRKTIPDIHRPSINLVEQEALNT